jgi:hypothetical protein
MIRSFNVLSYLLKGAVLKKILRKRLNLTWGRPESMAPIVQILRPGLRSKDKGLKIPPQIEGKVQNGCFSGNVFYSVLQAIQESLDLTSPESAGRETGRQTGKHTDRQTDSPAVRQS